ncbi:MAG TPA: hypothetical protein VIS48_12910 [Candidatus Kryptonia bacterium]
MKICCFLLSISFLSIWGCDVTNEHSSSSSFAIYRLKDSTLTAQHVWNLPIDSLILADAPFLVQDSLISYRWQTHEFVATASVDTELAILRRHNGPTAGIPFVVMVGRDRIYLGAFWYPYSSLSSSVPYIDVWLQSHQIQKAWTPIDSVDKRNDPRIYSALKNAGVLVE